MTPTPIKKALRYAPAISVVVLVTVAGQESDGSAAGVEAATSVRGHNLEEVLSTPTRGPRKLMELPYTVDRVPRLRLLGEQMAATVPEALLETPGAMIQQTAHGQGSPYLRGFTGFRTLLLVDGIRLNNSTFRDGPNQYWSTIDVLALDRLEIVKGPASVLYGSDAIGGTVNALMRQPRRVFGNEPQWGGAIYYRFGSAERAHLGRSEFGGALADRWGFNFGLSGKTLGDVEGGSEVGRQPRTGYDQWDVDGKAEYYLAPRAKLTVAYQRTAQDDVDRTHRTLDGLTWNGLSRGTDLIHEFDQRRELAYARIEAGSERGDTLAATLSWHRQDEFQYVVRGNSTSQENEVDVDTLGVAVQGTSPSRAGLWTYGVEYYRDFVDSAQRNYSAAGALSSVGVQGPVADDSGYDLVGAYVQDELPLGERWRLTLGGRHTYAAADAGRVRDPATGNLSSFRQSWHHAVGNVRLLWNPEEKKEWALFGGVSQGFRAPNFSDLSRFDIARSGELETAAFDLEPEKFHTLESGLKVSKKNWDASASYYFTWVEDLIVRTPTGNRVGGALEVTKRNASEGWVQGVEMAGRLRLGEGVSLFGSVAWQEGEADSFPTVSSTPVRAAMSRIHPWMGLAGLRWESPEPRLPIFVETFSLFAAEQDRLSPDDLRDTQRIPPGGTPGYATLNFRAGYDWKGKVKVIAALENALDLDYRIHGSGYNQPGRNVRLSFEYRF